MAPERPTKSPTLTDVARLAGVSAMTVSRVINEHPNVRVATRQRVVHAMDQLRYRPNPLARGLARGRSQTIGVVTFDTTQYGPGSSLLAIERAARHRGYGVTIAAIEHPDHAGIRAAVTSLDQRLVDGLVIIAPFVDTAGALRNLGRDIPIVVAEAGHLGEAPIVGINQVSGARLATRHLLRLGHPTVHHVAGPSQWIESRLRTDGWLRELQDAGVAPPPVIPGDWSATSGYEAGVTLSDLAGVSAVFVANDQMALGLLKALHDHHLRIPQDVSVVGFDDSPESAYFTPSLTTVRQQFSQLGEVAIDILHELMTSGPSDVPSCRMIEPTLTVRASTAAYRAPA